MRQPLVARPALPPAPANFGRPVAPPPVARGESLRTFTLKNRAALHQANRRLENDAAFYRDVVEDFGAEQPASEGIRWPWE